MKCVAPALVIAFGFIQVSSSQGPLVLIQPATVLVYDTTSGRQTLSFDICGDADDLFFDAGRKRLYVSCGEGFLDVFQQQDSGRFERTAHLQTAPGARTSLYVAEEDRVCLAVPHRGTQKTEVRVFGVRD
jgi:hypothetical protein